MILSLFLFLLLVSIFKEFEIKEQVRGGEAYKRVKGTLKGIRRNLNT